MTISGHGAPRPFSHRSIATFPRSSSASSSPRLRRVNGVCCKIPMPCRLVPCVGVSKSAPRLLHANRFFPTRFSASRIRMATPSAGQRQVWHVSRGIVFARDTRVVYPRLPMARYHSAPALSSFTRELSEPPPCSGLGSGDGQAPTVDDHVLAVDASATGETAAIASAAVEDSAETEDEPSLCEPLASDLEYKIPDESFQAARSASPGKPESFWSYSLYRGPSEDGSGVLDRKVKVHYCTSSHTTERVLKQYFLHEKVIGLDLEWAPNALKTQGPRRNVSVVQIASPSRIALFHLAVFPKGDNLAVPLLKQIMEDPEITKAGVWIKGDCTRLRTFLGIDARGIFELSHLYNLVQHSTAGQHHLVNKKIVNLATQVRRCLGLPLFKGDVRRSDWSQQLDMEQVVYAASDAYAAVQLFAVLDYQRRKLDPTPPLPHHAELNLPIEYLAPPTPDEEPEQEPIEVDHAATEGEAAAYTKYLESIDGINVEAEDLVDKSVSAIVTRSLSVTSTTTTTTTKTTTAITPVSKTKPPALQDPRVAEADLWARQYRIGRTAGKSQIPALRAYYLWHKNEDLGVKDVAALLRDPPLATSTVNNYIAGALRLDSLPFDKQRLWKDVLAGLPDATRDMWTFRPLVKACREVQSGGQVQ